MLNARQYSERTPSRSLRSTRWTTRRLDRHCGHDFSNSRFRAIQDESVDPNEPLVAESRPYSSAENSPEGLEMPREPWDRSLCCSVALSRLPITREGEGDGDPGMISG